VVFWAAAAAGNFADPACHEPAAGARGWARLRPRARRRTCQARGPALQPRGQRGEQLQHLGLRWRARARARAVGRGGGGGRGEPTRTTEVWPHPKRESRPTLSRRTPAHLKVRVLRRGALHEPDRRLHRQHKVERRQRLAHDPSQGLKGWGVGGGGRGLGGGQRRRPRGKRPAPRARHTPAPGSGPWVEAASRARPSRGARQRRRAPGPRAAHAISSARGGARRRDDPRGGRRAHLKADGEGLALDGGHLCEVAHAGPRPLRLDVGGRGLLGVGVERAGYWWGGPEEAATCGQLKRWATCDPKGAGRRRRGGGGGGAAARLAGRPRGAPLRRTCTSASISAAMASALSHATWGMGEWHGAAVCEWRGGR
jgi:hypothetical protein